MSVQPSGLEQTRDRLRAYQTRFQAGEDFTFGVFTRDESEVVGGSGLHENAGSRRIPEKLGFRLMETRVGD